MGDNETDIPRRGEANLHTDDNRDNLLDNDTLKHLRLWQ